MAVHAGLIYTNHELFEQYIPRLYHNGKWVKPIPKVYYDGEWHNVGSCSDIMVNMFVTPGTGDAPSAAAAAYPYTSDTLYTADSVEFLVRSAPLKIAGVKPLATRINISYTGAQISNGLYYSSRIMVTGDTFGTEAGTYTATYAPKSGYVWSDGTNDTITVILTISDVSGGVEEEPEEEDL